MMVDVALSIFLIGTLACEIAFIVVLWKALNKIGGIQLPVALLRELVNAWSERRVAPVDSESTGPVKSTSGRGGEESVDELPPEILAPSLKKPPRPQGGFGSRVGKSDDGSQLHERNQSTD
jgi:hypothetical protein